MRPAQNRKRNGRIAFYRYHPVDTLMTIKGIAANDGLERMLRVKYVMPKRIALIQGHPDRSPERFCRALQASYIRSAVAAAHHVDVIDVAAMDFPNLRSKADYESGIALPDIQRAQQIIGEAEHLVLIFPLWLGDLPGLLKSFFEQVFRPGFAYRGSMEDGHFQKLLKGKSARAVVTMGMPAMAYRFYFGAPAVKNLRRGIFQLCGIAPVRATLIGMVEKNGPHHEKWLQRIAALGRQGE